MEEKALIESGHAFVLDTAFGDGRTNSFSCIQCSAVAYGDVEPEIPEEVVWGPCPGRTKRSMNTPNEYGGPI